MSTPDPAPPPSPRSPTAREGAMRRLAEGETVAAVALSLGVTPQTVNRWRREPAGAVVYQAASEERSDALRATIAEARGFLEAHALKAAQTAVKHLGARKPADALRASSTVLDRVGIPRVQRVETPPPPVDTSALTDEELATYEAILRKIGATP